jgi:hypothetical protein
MFKDTVLYLGYVINYKQILPLVTFLEIPHLYAAKPAAGPHIEAPVSHIHPHISSLIPI